MNVEESGSYYVSVSHLSLNNSLEDKSTSVQMSGSGVQSPGTVNLYIFIDHDTRKLL